MRLPEELHAFVLQVNLAELVVFLRAQFRKCIFRSFLRIQVLIMATSFTRAESYRLDLLNFSFEGLSLNKSRRKRNLIEIS